MVTWIKHTLIANDWMVADLPMRHHRKYSLLFWCVWVLSCVLCGYKLDKQKCLNSETLDTNSRIKVITLEHQSLEIKMKLFLRCNNKTLYHMWTLSSKEIWEPSVCWASARCTTINCKTRIWCSTFYYCLWRCVEGIRLCDEEGRHIFEEITLFHVGGGCILVFSLYSTRSIKCMISYF